MTSNYSKLRGRIKEMYGSELKFSEVSKIHRNKLSKIFNGKSDFTVLEMRKVCSLLEISAEEVGSFFLD